LSGINRVDPVGLSLVKEDAFPLKSKVFPSLENRRWVLGAGFACLLKTPYLDWLIKLPLAG